MSKKLEGRVAVVTGASKGIGAQIAIDLAGQGASVVVNYASSKTGAEKVVNEITAQGGKAVAIQADVSKQADITRLFAETKKAFGKLDILVNNAGVYDFAPLEAITPEFYHKMFDLNVLGLILTTQEAVKHFGPQGGSIINISSLVARATLAMTSVYSATKAAVNSLTQTLSAELGPKNIRVNSVNPGMVETEGNVGAHNTEDPGTKMVLSRTSLGRIGKVDDIAPVVLFLASEDAKWITGESIYVAGGYA